MENNYLILCELNYVAITFYLLCLYLQLPTEIVSRSQNAPDRMYKIVLAGDAAVGKSSLIMRLCKGVFQTNLNSTLGMFLLHLLKIE